jgi:hypothetical protein
MYRNFGFIPSAENAETMAKAILAWWAEVRYQTAGDRGERNVFDETPVFVEMAQKMLGEPSNLTYLETCRAKVEELSSLLEDFTSIAETESLDLRHRFQLVMAPACKGRILQLLESLGTPASLDYWDPGILGYDTCINLTKSEFDAQLQSLKNLCPGLLPD